MRCCLRYLLLLCSTILVCLMHLSLGINNGLGKTPHMGWNTWNYYGCAINQSVVRASADAAQKLGLLAAGYEYITIDDCWQVGRTTDGTIVADPDAFPDGIKSLADYVHSLGFKFGLYSSAGYKTCQGRPASLGYETIDANTYAAWGVDMLRYDNCNTDGSPPEIRYYTMSQALNVSGRPIYFQMCDWGVNYPALWGSSIGNSWRTTNDISASYWSMINNLDNNDPWADFAGPGGWNDPDNLEVGNSPMTLVESQAHFGLWALIKGPLMLGMNLMQISSEVLQIITAPEVIAINQDSLGVQGKLVAYTEVQEDDRVATQLVRTSKCLSSNQTQQFYFDESSATIRSVLGDRCLQVWNCWNETQGSLVAAPCYASNSYNLSEQCNFLNQQWTYTSAQQLILKMNGFCLDLYNSQGPAVQMYHCLDGANQQWTYNTSTKTLQTVFDLCLTLVPNRLEVWAAPLSDGSLAVSLFNRLDLTESKITVTWEQLGIENRAQKMRARDLFAQEDIGDFEGAFTSPQPIPAHGALLVKLSPV